MVILKVTKKKTKLETIQTAYFLKHILRVKERIFFEWNFNISTSRMPKLWHMYMMTYGDFMVTVEPSNIIQLTTITRKHQSHQMELKQPYIYKLERVPLFYNS